MRKAANIATPHAGTYAPLRPYPWYSWDACGPAASIVSSANDMAKWVALHLNGGAAAGRRLFSEDAPRVMWTPHVSFTTDPNAAVTVENGGLVLRLLPNPDMVADLARWRIDTFELTWRRAFPWFGGGRAPFVLDHDAGVTELKLDVPNDDLWFHELEFTRK